MDQPMRWVCLCLDAHNFVAGPAPRADEISRMMHRGHVRPPSRDSPPAAYMLRSQIHQPIWVALCLFLNPPPTAADKALRQASTKGARQCWRRFFCCGWKPFIGCRRDRHPRATLGSSLSRCHVLLHARCGCRSRVGISRTLIDRFAQRVLPHSERAVDPLHCPGMDAEPFGNDAHTGPSTYRDDLLLVRFRATADINARVASTASVVNDPLRS